MLDPLIMAHRNRLIICDKSFFEGIGFLDEVNNKLAMNVDSDGNCNLQWIIDFNGLFYKLNNIGESKATLLTRIGWDRRQSYFSIVCPTKITSGKLKEILNDFSDEFSDVKNVSDLLMLLENLKKDHVISVEDLRIYHNEE